MPELSTHELLSEWRKALDAVGAPLSSVGDHLQAPHELVELMRRQLELMQALMARERRLGERAASELLAPIDAVFDLLEASGATLRKQADALESAGQALEESARLVKTQAALFERAISTMREPADRARAVIGLERRADKTAQPGPRPAPKRRAARARVGSQTRS